MINVVFFARVREALGTDGLQMAAPEAPDLDTLLSTLRQRGEPWASVLAEANLLHAVNHEVVHGNTVLNDGDEVAFYPPVTGG
ncbi:MoaD/ThiS family protein [Parahaliea aestuarii]|uniref:Molybdopterin synthase sulfur carrier subunit n=1 Tax=Parahaliea aestuarii TaxID=1852021 RepID=A0A5C8ZR98_9GAMM|nr:MoaD/ThiS family protein [Parahaliea aestuarii]TXS90998.1 molybdopterin synthase sulfur carrier subunit [Parahaliea aestuarii]